MVSPYIPARQRESTNSNYRNQWQVLCWSRLEMMERKRHPLFTKCLDISRYWKKRMQQSEPRKSLNKFFCSQNSPRGWFTWEQGWAPNSCLKLLNLLKLYWVFCVVSLKVVVHTLSLDPNFPPIKQKKWLIAKVRNRFVKEEVTKLLNIGSIREVYYLDWLLNIVFVTKKK